MFFNIALMNSKTLGNVWRAAHDVETDAAENDLPKICNRLSRWVESDGDTVQERLSLRTSSALISGAARLFKTDAEQLFDDVKKLDAEMFRSKARRPNYTGLDISKWSDSSENLASPETIRRQADVQFETSITPRYKRHKRFHSPILGTARPIMIRCPSNRSSTTRSDRSSSQDLPVHDVNSPGLYKGCRNPQTKDQGTQTSLDLNRAGIESGSDAFHPDLPFGYILIHDNYRSRIPTRIIFSSMNKDVTRLI